MTNNERNAKLFCEAIKKLAENPDALENLECYLARHFKGWLETYASTPEGITDELQQFAKIR